ESKYPLLDRVTARISCRNRAGKGTGFRLKGKLHAFQVSDRIHAKVKIANKRTRSGSFAQQSNTGVIRLSRAGGLHHYNQHTGRYEKHLCCTRVVNTLTALTGKKNLHPPAPFELCV